MFSSNNFFLFPLALYIYETFSLGWQWSFLFRDFFQKPVIFLPRDQSLEAPRIKMGQLYFYARRLIQVLLPILLCRQSVVSYGIHWKRKCCVPYFSCCLEPGFSNSEDKNHQSFCTITEPTNLWDTTILYQMMTKLPALKGKKHLQHKRCCIKIQAICSAKILALKPDSSKVQILAQALARWKNLWIFHQKELCLSEPEFPSLKGVYKHFAE